MNALMYAGACLLASACVLERCNTNYCVMIGVSLETMA